VCLCVWVCVCFWLCAVCVGGVWRFSTEFDEVSKAFLPHDVQQNQPPFSQ